MKCSLGISNFLEEISAAAKSLQLCLTLCNPIDSSPPGSPVPGILRVRILEWVAISFSNAWKWKVKVKSLSRAQLLATPWTTAHQAPPSKGFSRQEYRSGVPLPSPPSNFLKEISIWIPTWAPIIIFLTTGKIIFLPVSLTSFEDDREDLRSDSLNSDSQCFVHPHTHCKHFRLNHSSTPQGGWGSPPSLLSDAWWFWQVLLRLLGSTALEPSASGKYHFSVWNCLCVTFLFKGSSFYPCCLFYTY